MEPLSINRRVLIWLYMFPSDGSITSRLKKSISICLSVAVCITLAACVLSSITYAFRFISIDLKETIYATFPIIACSAVIYVHIVAIFSRQKIFELFKKLSQIYKKSEKNPNSLRLHMNKKRFSNL